MSITNFDKPSPSACSGGTYQHYRVRWKLVHVATSNQTAQPDFKYFFEVEENGTKISEAYVSANPAGVGMIDLASYIKERLSLPFYDSSDSYSIHNGNNASRYLTSVQGAAGIYEVIAGEVYTSGGVLTEFAGTASSTNELLIINGSFDRHLGDYAVCSAELRQNLKGFTNNVPSSTIEVYSGFLTTVKEDTYTHIPKAMRLAKVYDSVRRVYPVPTQSTNLGQLAWVHDSSFITNGASENIVIRYYDTSDNLLYTLTIDATSTGNGGQALTSTDADGKIISIPAHEGAQNNNSLINALRNINASTWDYYIVDLTDSGGSASSHQMLYFKHCYDNRFKHYQIAWDNGVGFFDYYTFELKSEHSDKVEKKYYSTNVGSWEASTFKETPYEHGTIPHQVRREKRYKLSTGKIGEATAEYLRSLVYSRRIDLIDDEGNVCPVILEDQNLTYNVDKSTSMREYTFTFKLANEIEA